jgi:cephalosporin-C deacetylase
VANIEGKTVNTDLRIVVTTDDYTPVKSTGCKVSIGKNASANVKYSPGEVAPGFYRLSVYDGDTQLKIMNFGFEPEKIVSPTDSQADIRAYWDKALAELATVPGNYTMEEIPEKSGKARKMYLVSMTSLEGDTIRGYLMLPVKPGKYPAHIYYNGYGAQPWDMDPEGNPEWIEFQTYVRGQGLNAKYNKYGDWIVYNLDNLDHYYYRGAFMDAVRFIDFIYQLPQTDTRNIFTEGGSQGGALTLASGALDSRVKAIAPYIPFLSDYRDYFRIVHWPAEPVLKAAKQLGMTDEQLYKTLSYFDIKNLAGWIKCPVLMGAGLQDPVCPPHTNFSGYNLITSPKEFIIYPNKEHTVDYSDWSPRVNRFYERYIFK